MGLHQEGSCMSKGLERRQPQYLQRLRGKPAGFAEANVPGGEGQVL